MSAVLWGDMIVIGTALNILASLAAVALLVYGASTAMALTVHFAPVPWNVFLFLAVWRGSQMASMSEALTARLTAIIWLVAVTVI